jgi:aspartate aminotransferase-like enzyme
MRVGLMGFGSSAENVLMVLDALEAALKAQGFKPRGNARAAAGERIGVTA